MKTKALLTLVSLSAFIAVAGEDWNHKKGKAGHGFNSAAERYDHQAEKMKNMADKEQDPAIRAKMLELSKKNRSLAQHKRNATASQKKGEGYDWKEYHKTHAEAQNLWKEVREEKGWTKKAGKEDHKEKKAARKEMRQEKKQAIKKEHTSYKKDVAEDKYEKGYQKESKPISKTYETESGFKIRTSL